MIRLIIKVLLFFAAVAAGILGLRWIGANIGPVSFEALGTQYTFAPQIAIIGLLLLLLAFYIVVRMIEGVWKTPRALRRRAEKKGVESLTRGLIAVASGDSKQALRYAGKAERLLTDQRATALLQAQAHEMAGNAKQARQYYDALMKNPETEFVGVRGLLTHAISEGNDEVSMLLANRAMALRPKQHWVLSTVFDLQSAQGDWAAARATLGRSVSAKLIDKGTGRRREAVALLSEALAKRAEGDEKAALERARAALSKAPGLSPAAALAASLLASSGAKREAASVLERAWEQSPHPDLAAAYAGIEPDESADARLKRFARLIARNPKHLESALLKAELALSAEDFPAAKAAIAALDLPERDVTARIYAIKAAIAKGEGQPEDEVRAWLARALSAPVGAQWVCEGCGHSAPRWRSVCSSCNAFDSLAWKAPVVDEEALGDTRVIDQAIAPLLGGARESESRDLTVMAEDAATSAAKS